MIKKVVIPTTEIRYVCELSEKEFENSKAIVCHDSMVETLEAKWHKREIPKPLVDDEVSVEDVNRYDILTFVSNSEEIFEIDKMFPYGNYKALLVGQHHSTWSIAGIENTDLQEVLRYLMQDQNQEIYCISGKNKQQEFFEWALSQLGGK